MNFGLKDIEIDKLRALFSAYTDIERVILYGSRAKGNYKPFSDIDITLVGNGLTDSLLNKLLLDVDDLLLPYKVDVSIFNTLTNRDLIDHINRVGVVIYDKYKYV